MTLNVGMDLNELTNLCSLANARRPQDDECVFRHWDIIKDLSLVPLRWLIPILLDSHLMHFNKPQPEVWLGPPLQAPHCETQQLVTLLEGQLNNLKVTLEQKPTNPSPLARHKKADWCVRLPAESSCEFSQRWRFSDHQQCCVTRGLRVIRRP